jgi:hypothetical protein
MSINHHAFQQLARILEKSLALEIMSFLLSQIGIADYLCLGQFMHLDVSFLFKIKNWAFVDLKA